MKLREGLRNVLGVGSFPLVTFLKLTGARQLSPNVSTTVYDNGQQSPLVVLRAGSSGTDAALPRPELEIFAEDPSWTFKVEDFMVSTGADALAVEAALQEVRQISWAAGRTFRPKYLVLLAFAEDTHHHGDEQASCRLVRAVLAASKHTAFAHFVLVADGFALDASTREAMETALDEGGWRSFTSVEVPEFEGFSSAVNRAMNTILDNAVVAVLSTSVLLLHASNADTSIHASSTDVPASDIFVAYERLKDASRPSRGSSAGTSATSHRSNVDIGEDARRYKHGHVDHQSNIDAPDTLLVTAPPSRFASGRQRDEDSTTSDLQKAGGRGLSTAKRSEYGQEQDVDPEGNRPARLQTHALSAPSAGPQELVMRLSEVAPLPLLVFDTETFARLGELDERFSFQGGVGEWISRAKLEHVDHGIESKQPSDLYCDQLSSGRRGSPKKMRPESHRASSTGPFFEGVASGAVKHIHEHEWGTRFIRAWREDVAGTASYRVSSEARVEHAKEEAVVDQWTRLSPADLETLAQADADLFFLQLLLSWPSPESAPHNDTVARCIAFHSEWMERSPDDELVTETLNRRTQFPVAAVVVVHDDISLMRTALEEVALVVEHILVVVSVRPWNGGAGEVEDTLEMLSSIVEDVQSPTHGKLRVEVGSWPTEQDQREYGNSVIREDPRNFSRVVAMDTDEFWHPVELAKALVLAQKNPELTRFWAEMDTYWASLRSVIHPPERLLVLWLIDPHRCAWLRTREVDCGTSDGDVLKKSTGFMRHLSYVRTEEDIRRKMATFSHAGEEQSGWYTSVWLGWAANNSCTDLHPVFPENFKRVIVQSLFRLTPALRTLHLDAKKGRDAVSAGDLAVNRSNTSSSPVSPMGKSSVEGRSAVRDEMRPHDEHECGPFVEGTSQRVCGQGATRRVGARRGNGLDSIDKHDIRSSRKVHPVGFAGCEEKLVSQWTDRQRMMCLIPDVGGVAAT